MSQENKPAVHEKYAIKKLYPYQEYSLEKIFSFFDDQGSNTNLLFQLPTGGGKTIIFSHVAEQYVKKTGKKVLILTHRIELLVQTSECLKGIGLDNMVISSEVKEVADQDNYSCFIAMVETLNNRLQDNEDFLKNIGLVIVDEAHNNSFRKIFQYFDNVNMLGVTATPLSSNRNLPLNKNYAELIVGASISDLISNTYLCTPTTYSYDVSLGGLRVGINGDFTVSSSEKLYGGFDMQDKLVAAYLERGKGTKTLIFNPGIRVSWMVYDTFREQGITNIKHLDSTCSDQERKDILTWFRTTDGAILSSVGILTTGFDEPSVETIILNRATRSLTLYHQMIGRGSRVTKNKINFSIIDLGNNNHRFGLWEEFIDWAEVFINPDKYLDQSYFDEVEKQRELVYNFPDDVIDRFPMDTESLFLDVTDVYDGLMDRGEKGNLTVDIAIENHVQLISQNADSMDKGMDLIEVLQDSIKNRIKLYTNCITKSTKNYMAYLLESYNRKLSMGVRKAIREQEEEEEEEEEEED